MEHAAEEARRGNLEFIGSLPQPELLRLLGKHDEDGRTLLHSAAAGGSSALVSYLLEHGAVSAVNRPDEEGWTPLHSAVSAGHDLVVERLVGLDADVNAKTSGGQTPLHYAASKGRLSLVELLLNHSASLAVTDRQGASALHRAAATGKTEVAKALLQRPGGKQLLEAKDETGQTALHCAVRAHQHQTALFLVVSGAAIDVQDAELQTPWDAAAGVGKLQGTMTALAKGDLDYDDLL